MRPVLLFAIALLAAAVYVPLCAPVSGMGDSSEFTLVLATNGVAHPTGYPLYTLFGHLFCMLLHGAGIGWPLAAALWSVAGAAVALLFLSALAMELVARVPGAGKRTKILAPLVPVALFASSPVVLGEATRAEINIWNLAWACGAAFVFVRLADPIGASQEKRARDVRAAAALWGFVCGLGLAHHLTSVLVSAPLTAALIAILARRRQLSPSVAGFAAGAALVPMASYGIIAWHAWHPAAAQWPLLEPGLGSVIHHITGAGYRHYLGHFAPASSEAERLTSAVYPFLLPGLALLFLGVWRASGAERRIVASALLAAAAFVSAFPFFYGVPDPAPYFLPAMALGVAAAAPAIASIPGVDSRAGVAATAVAGLVSLLVIVPWFRDGRDERDATLAFEKVIRSMWSAIPPDTAIVSWTDDRFNRLLEYQVLRGEKPALFIVTPDMLAADIMRHRIRARFGADPMEGFEAVGMTAPVSPGTEEEKRAMNEARRRLLRGLSDRIRVPVILFDPSVPIVWQFRKPWEPADGRGEPARSPVRWAHPAFRK
jgi:hypothetical protein